jgi:retinol dehydrogenase 12
MAKTTFWDLVRLQRRTPPPVVHADLSGKTVMVIGSSSGMGLEAAKHFARMHPARLILTARSEARGRAVVEGMSLAAVLEGSHTIVNRTQTGYRV